jgi:DNA-binding transcriptional LysR family regulator
MDERPGAQRPIEVEPPFDLRQLRYFLAVTEELNFTRAAARLHVAQQSLSATISDLERTLGVQLFDRSTRHVALTNAGESLVPAARRVLADVADALHELKEAAAGRRGRLVVGVAVAVHGLPLVREVIRRFVAASPRVDAHVIGHDYSDPTAGLASRASNVAFVLGPLSDPGLESVTVLAEPRSVMLPANHRLAKRADLRARDLKGLPWLRVPVVDSAWTRFWFQHPLGETSTGPEVRSGVEWVPAVAAGRGVGYTLPTLAAGYLPPEIVAIPIVDIEPGSVLLAWPRDRADALTEAFLTTARSTFAECGPDGVTGRHV